jgi:predicted O-linked N-acetylglucosamine transferase (SPINDLY family)
MVTVWARILNLLPGARLMLGNVNDAATEARIADMFDRAEVSANRLVLLPKMTLADYLATHHQIDLALDTYPYGGGTTTSHSLWMGVPVVTLAGATSASRQGAAMLAGVGLEEFVTTSEDEYVSRTAQLAQDLPGLSSVRQGLRLRLESVPATDAVGLTRSLEQAYATIWQKYCQA